MGNERNNSSPLSDPIEESDAQIYEIRVKGCKDEVFWVDWFGNMAFSTDLDHEETTLRGPLTDQAELFGLLSRLRNKGLILISIHQIPQETKYSE